MDQMSTQPLEQAVEAARTVLAGISADQLSASTPCAQWDVAGLINHLVGAQGFFKAGMTGEPPADAGDPASGDFVAAFDAASAEAIAVFQVEGALEKTHTLPFGEMPGAAVMGLAMNDTFQHAWDLAKATGQSTDLNPELATALLAQAQQSIPDTFRGPEGAPFGVQQDCPEGASPADQLAAFLGRAI
jgi:uncharacterized protein (TIGR03086 family)